MNKHIITFKNSEKFDGIHQMEISISNEQNVEEFFNKEYYPLVYCSSEKI
ncbi:hypothetical protein [Tenacibaculum maritimum]|nr:hypothetical protein [Tenacibaculum maritimum]